MNPSFVLEDQYTEKIISGTDEVGCGSIAGPVVACSIVLDRLYDCSSYVADSKILSANKRNYAYDFLVSNNAYAIGVASVQEIDCFNIRNATILACERSIANLSLHPEICLVDGNMKFKDNRCVSYIKGDQLSYSIAAASIIAKVFRDHLMCLLSLDHNVYEWQKNKGYGTRKHLEALKKWGPSLIHRQTFIKKYL